MTSEPTSGLSLVDIAVQYGDVVAVSGFDLSVSLGEVVALLGPSGCGKSSVLSAITGIVTPSAGTVVWNGIDVTNVATHLRGIGMMFQDNALFPHKNVAGNIEFGLRMQKMAPEARSSRIGEMLELVGLPGYGERGVDELSGGQQQRVALARALAPEPGLLLLDEPLGSLDRDLRDRLADDLRTIFTSTGTTVLFVTHDRDEAGRVADRTVVMAAPS